MSLFRGKNKAGFSPPENSREKVYLKKTEGFRQFSLLLRRLFYILLMDEMVIAIRLGLRKPLIRLVVCTRL